MNFSFHLITINFDIIAVLCRKYLRMIFGKLVALKFVGKKFLCHQLQKLFIEVINVMTNCDTTRITSPQFALVVFSSK